MLGRAGLVKRVRQRFTSMQDLCEFMVDTGNKMFKGTEWEGKWFIYGGFDHCCASVGPSPAAPIPHPGAAPHVM